MKYGIPNKEKQISRQIIKRLKYYRSALDRRQPTVNPSDLIITDHFYSGILVFN